MPARAGASAASAGAAAGPDHPARARQGGGADGEGGRGAVARGRCRAWRWPRAAAEGSLRADRDDRRRPSGAGRERASRRPSGCSRWPAGPGADDLVLVLLSGGASALACLPGEGLELAEKQRLTRALLRSGAERARDQLRPPPSVALQGRPPRSRGGAGAAGDARHLRRGRRLAPEDIGSGPTAADPTSLERRPGDPRPLRHRGAGAGLVRDSGRRCRAPGASSPTRRRCARGGRGRRLGGSATRSGCSNARARRATVGRDHAALALRRGARAPPSSPAASSPSPCAAPGRGGPNQEYALAAALALAGRAGIAGSPPTPTASTASSEAAGAFFRRRRPRRRGGARGERQRRLVRRRTAACSSPARPAPTSAT